MYKQKLDISVKDGIRISRYRMINYHHTVDDGNRAIGVSSW